MKHLGFKVPFTFPAGDIRFIKKFKVKLPKDVERLERIAVILIATIDRGGVVSEFKSPTHLSLNVGNKKEPASNIVFKEGCDIRKGISFIELYKDIYPAGQYIAGYFDITRDVADVMHVVTGSFTLVLKTNS
jgi:hypothetical protein